MDRIPRGDDSPQSEREPLWLLRRALQPLDSVRKAINKLDELATKTKATRKRTRAATTQQQPRPLKVSDDSDPANAGVAISLSGDDKEFGALLQSLSNGHGDDDGDDNSTILGTKPDKRRKQNSGAYSKTTTTDDRAPFNSPMRPALRLTSTPSPSLELKPRGAPKREEKKKKTQSDEKHATGARARGKLDFKSVPASSASTSGVSAAPVPPVDEHKLDDVAFQKFVAARKKVERITDDLMREETHDCPRAQALKQSLDEARIERDDAEAAFRTSVNATTRAWAARSTSAGTR